MTVLKRVGFFSIGFIMGIGILVFILSGKKASCAYFPNARTLKNIRLKQRNFSPEALAFFTQNKIDTSIVSNIFEEGDVDFGKSKTHTEPCKTYYINGKAKDSISIEIQVKNCDSTATIQKAHFYTED